MDTKPKLRKRRSDRKHIVYVITNEITCEKYVGISVCVDRSGKETLNARWSRHVGRALNENKNWKLCESIRKYGKESFSKSILQFVRGKENAHVVENSLRKSGQFTLNTL